MNNKIKLQINSLSKFSIMSYNVLANSLIDLTTSEGKINTENINKN